MMIAGPHLRDTPRLWTEQSMIIRRRITPVTLLLAAAACTSGTDRAATTDSAAVRPSAANDTRPAVPSITPAMTPASDSAVTEHADDSSFAIVFATSKGRVTRYRAGRRPAVEYVEGCG